MYYPIQRYKFESNSQLRVVVPLLLNVVLSDTKIQIWKQFTTSSSTVTALLRCIIRYKDTNLKAIHNEMNDILIEAIVVLSDTKIQIWKQFTTWDDCNVLRRRLYYPIQRYKFEKISTKSPILWITHLRVTRLLHRRLFGWGLGWSCQIALGG